jgi:hypothetical protein
MSVDAVHSRAVVFDLENSLFQQKTSEPSRSTAISPSRK